MEDLTIYQGGQLPDTLEDLTQFVLVGQATLNAYMLKLRTVNKLSVAQEIRDQTLKEAQDISTALIAAEQRIGEILLSIPKASGHYAESEILNGQKFTKPKAEVISEMGYNKNEAHDYQTMAKNPEVVQKVIDDALSKGDVVTKTQVLKAIKEARDTARREAEEEAQKQAEQARREAEEAQKALEQAEAQLDELKAKEPEPKIIQVIPDDYGKLKADCEKAKSTAERAEQDYIKVWQQSLEKDKKIKELESQLGRDKLLKEADRDVRTFTSSTYTYIRMYGGHAWAFEQLDELSDPVREDFIKAIKTLDGFAQRMIQMLEGNVNG